MLHLRRCICILKRSIFIYKKYLLFAVGGVEAAWGDYWEISQDFLVVLGGGGLDVVVLFEIPLRILFLSLCKKFKALLQKKGGACVGAGLGHLLLNPGGFNFLYCCFISLKTLKLVCKVLDNCFVLRIQFAGMSNILNYKRAQIYAASRELYSYRVRFFKTASYII